MSWQRRGNKLYFYHVARVGGRLLTSYLGSGPEAEAVAQASLEARADREAARESRRRLESHLGRIGRLAQAVGRAMELSGFYIHRGVWRKRGLRTMQFKNLDRAVGRETGRRYFEALPPGELAAEVERLRVDVAGLALLELAALVSPDPARQEAVRRHVEVEADELAGPSASPLTRLLARLAATLATETDIASGRLYRVAGMPGGLETPTGAAAYRWAKSARRAAMQAAKCLAMVQDVERRESERSVRRPRYKVVG